MTFSALTNFVVGDDQGMQRWLLEHYYEHLLFNQEVQALGAPIPSYPIQTMDHPEEWLSAHQRIHQGIWTAIGGGVASDLGRLDWQDESQVYNWLGLHAAIHTNVRTSLGL